MDNEIISVNSVKFSAGSGDARTDILKGITFTACKGDFISIMGPSGAGKTTLMNVVGGLLTPGTGKVIVDGIDIYGLDMERRADFRRLYLGFVFQSFHLFPYMTVCENVILPLVNADMSKSEKEERAVSVLRNVGLTGNEGKYPSQISGGEAQRVAIARALINNPMIILADEPTGNLDSRNGDVVLDLFTGLNEKGKTIIMITHSREYSRRARSELGILDGELLGISHLDYAAV